MKSVLAFCLLFCCLHAKSQNSNPSDTETTTIVRVTANSVFLLDGDTYKTQGYENEFVEGWITESPIKTKLNEFRKEKIAFIKSIPQNAAKYLKYDHSMYHYRCDCNVAELSLLQVIDYDTNGQVLNNVGDRDLPVFEIKDIVPKSSSETIYKYMCHYKGRFKK